MAARAPFSDSDITRIRELLDQIQQARTEIDRAERVGIDQQANRAKLDEHERVLRAILLEYADEHQP